MRYVKAKVGTGLILLVLFTGLSWAGIYDLNPGMEAVKYKHEMTDDVTGQGYVMEYKKVKIKLMVDLSAMVHQLIEFIGILKNLIK